MPLDESAAPFWDPEAEDILVSAMRKMFSRYPRSVLIDFPPGANGNFLEYIVNAFIFDVECPANPFSKIYTIKCAEFSHEYHRTRKCLATHWTILDVKYSLEIQNKLIRIQIDPNDKVGRLIHRINHSYRVGDEPLRNYKDDIQEERRLRSRLQQEYLQLEPLSGWKPHNGPILDVNFMDFYDQNKFMEMLRNIALFAGRSPRRIESALPYYNTYIENNHGWVFYNRAVECMQQLIHSDSPSMELNVVEQAVVLSLCLHEFNRRYPNTYNPFYECIGLFEFDLNQIKSWLFPKTL